MKKVIRQEPYLRNGNIKSNYHTATHRAAWEQNFGGYDVCIMSGKSFLKNQFPKNQARPVVGLKWFQADMGQINDPLNIQWLFATIHGIVAHSTASIALRRGCNSVGVGVGISLADLKLPLKRSLHLEQGFVLLGRLVELWKDNIWQHGTPRFTAKTSTEVDPQGFTRSGRARSLGGLHLKHPSCCRPDSEPPLALLKVFTDDATVMDGDFRWVQCLLGRTPCQTRHASHTKCFWMRCQLLKHLP